MKRRIINKHLVLYWFTTRWKFEIIVGPKWVKPEIFKDCVGDDYVNFGWFQFIRERR